MKNAILVGVYRPSTGFVHFDVDYFNELPFAGPGAKEAKRLLMEKYGAVDPALVWPCIILHEAGYYTALLLPV